MQPALPYMLEEKYEGSSCIVTLHESFPPTRPSPFFWFRTTGAKESLSKMLAFIFILDYV
jgi:hypothetical protein